MQIHRICLFLLVAAVSVSLAVAGRGKGTKTAVYAPSKSYVVPHSKSYVPTYTYHSKKAAPLVHKCTGKHCVRHLGAKKGYRYAHYPSSKSYVVPHSKSYVPTYTYHSKKAAPLVHKCTGKYCARRLGAKKGRRYGYYPSRSYYAPHSKSYVPTYTYHSKKAAPLVHKCTGKYCARRLGAKKGRRYGYYPSSKSYVVPHSKSYVPTYTYHSKKAAPRVHKCTGKHCLRRLGAKKGRRYGYYPSRSYYAPHSKSYVPTYNTYHSKKATPVVQTCKGKSCYY